MRSKGSLPRALQPQPGEHHQAPSQALLTHFLSLQFTIAFQDKDFKVTLPDGHVLTFPNRLGHNHLHYLGMEGLQISSFKFE